MNMTQDEHDEILTAINENRATELHECDICNDDYWPNKAPLRGLLRTSTRTPRNINEEVYTVLHLSCGHKVI